MQLPDYLVCTADNDIIDFDSVDLQNLVLLRKTVKLPVKTDNGILDLSSLKPIYGGQRKRFDDLSTNIHPEFRLEDLPIRLKSERALEPCMTSTDRSIDFALNIDFEVQEPVYPIYLPCSLWHRHELEIGGKFFLIKIVHTPVRGNYWHASVRCFDDAGNHIAESMSERRRKQVYDAIITLLSHIAFIDAPTSG